MSQGRAGMYSAIVAHRPWRRYYFYSVQAADRWARRRLGQVEIRYGELDTMVLSYVDGEWAHITPEVPLGIVSDQKWKDVLSELIALRQEIKDRARDVTVRTGIRKPHSLNGEDSKSEHCT